MDNLIPHLPSDPNSSCHHNNKDKKRRCLFCGRYYKADPRLGVRQKSCPQSNCRKRLKRQSQQAWLKKNPGYFAKRYESALKPWRIAHSDYQRQRRARLKREIQESMPYNSSIITMNLAVMDHDLREIQDAIARHRANGRGVVVHGRLLPRDTRRDSHVVPDEALRSP